MKKRTKKAPIRKPAKKAAKRALPGKVNAKPASKTAKRPAKAAKTSRGEVRASSVPAGYHTLTPYLIVRGGAAAISFYKEAFGAKEKGVLTMADGKIGHAEILIGDSHVMLADEMPEWGAHAPETLGGTPCGLALYVPDVDRVFARAVAAGAKVDRPVADQFYGDRTGTIIDPFGHKWTIATHTEDVSFQEMQKRSDSLMKPGS